MNRVNMARVAAGLLLLCWLGPAAALYALVVQALCTKLGEWAGVLTPSNQAAQSDAVAFEAQRDTVGQLLTTRTLEPGVFERQITMHGPRLRGDNSWRATHTPACTVCGARMVADDLAVLCIGAHNLHEACAHVAIQPFLYARFSLLCRAVDLMPRDPVAVVTLWLKRLCFMSFAVRPSPNPVVRWDEGVVRDANARKNITNIRRLNPRREDVNK